MLEVDRSSDEDGDILLQELIAMLPSLFISHGSPMLALEPGASGPALARLAAELPRPRAVLVVSAHWESQRLLLTAGEHPATWHDFGGFPAALYAVQYPAPGAPQLAAEVAQQLVDAGLPAELDAQRPFDHGAWVPLSLMYPQADIPMLQLSLPSRLGPELQTRVGRALAGLRAHGILLIGSGSITHNLGELDWRAPRTSSRPGPRRFATGSWKNSKPMTNRRYTTIANWHRKPHATTPPRNTCCHCSSLAALAVPSPWRIRASPMVRWAWISIASTRCF